MQNMVGVVPNAVKNVYSYRNRIRLYWHVCNVNNKDHNIISCTDNTQTNSTRHEYVAISEQ